ncbi:MAG TPA: hypothetical protein VJ806_00205 [Luteimonas sp.]|nr:hypothetical protein [Luteimonas sp.]
MRRYLGSIVLAAVALPAFAQRVPVMSAEEMQGLMPNGAKMETRVDGDFNGDGETDTAFVWRSEEGVDEARGLMVGVAYRNEFDMGHDPAGELSLDPFPLGSASLSVRKSVLIVEDLTGGTTATQSTRRYRYDAKQRKMRLIGIDAERYSRTNSHGTTKISWNLLDGTHIVERGEPNTDPKSDAALVYAKPERTVRKSLPVWMEESPDPDELIDAEIVPEGEDRD